MGDEEASCQQQSPATGSPLGSTARFSPPPSLLPAPCLQPAPRQAPLSGRSRRGHRLLSPTVAPHLFPRRWRSPDPSHPRTAAPLSQAGPCLNVQRGPLSGPRGLASPVQQYLPMQQGWAPTPAARGYRLPKSSCCTLAFGQESEPGFQLRPIPSEGGLRKPRGSSSEASVSFPMLLRAPLATLGRVPATTPT